MDSGRAAARWVPASRRALLGGSAVVVSVSPAWHDGPAHAAGMAAAGGLGVLVVVMIAEIWHRSTGRGSG